MFIFAANKQIMFIDIATFVALNINILLTMNDFATILLNYLQQKGINQSEFAESLGWNRSVISNYKNGNNKPNTTTLQKIKEKYKDFPVEFNYIEDFKQTLTIVSEPAPEYKTTVGKPVYDIYGRAGKTNLVNTLDSAVVLYNLDIPAFKDCMGYIFVKGDSMSDYLKNGDMVAIKKVDIDMVFFGMMYFIEFMGDFAPEPVIKYIRKGSDKEHWLLRSHNDKYEDTEIPISKVKAVYTVRGGIIEIQ